MLPDKRNALAYYQSLGFDKFQSWKEEDLAGFLIYDFFDTFSLLPWSKNNNEETFLKAQLRKIQKYQSYRFLLTLIDKFFLLFYLVNVGKNKKNILFEGSQYPRLILEAKKYHNVRFMVHAKEDRVFAARHGIGYFSLNDFDPLLVLYLKEKDVKYLHQVVEKMEERLKLVKPDYIVLCMDMLALERVIILAAKKLSIPTIVVQHAMYDAPTCSLDFRVADYILVWGEYFRKLCKDQCLREIQDIEILGYAYDLKEGKETHPKKRTVCYLGQDLESHDEAILPLKIKTVQKLNSICKELDLEFIYRPHKRRESQEILREHFSNILVTPHGESLHETFAKTDICISFSSTALIEATMAGKVTIQLINYPVATDNLETLGACNKSLETLDQLREYLILLKETPSLKEYQKGVSSYYIDTKYDPGKRFLEIIGKLNITHSYGSK